jgi:hypothetical protein
MVTLSRVTTYRIFFFFFLISFLQRISPRQGHSDPSHWSKLRSRPPNHRNRPRLGFTKSVAFHESGFVGCYFKFFNNKKAKNKIIKKKHRKCIFFYYFFLQKNINNIFKFYIINRKLKLRFIYYFMLGNPSKDGRSDPLLWNKPWSRSPHARKV